MGTRLRARFGTKQGLAGVAAELFTAQAGQLESLHYPRSQAFALFGLYHRLSASRTAACWRSHEARGSDRGRFETTATPDWLWFEDALTYCNAKLPAALLLAFELTEIHVTSSIGTTALRWLRGVVSLAMASSRLVGQDGWYPRGGAKAAFDEQCVDAQGMVEAALIAERVTGEGSWRAERWLLRLVSGPQRARCHPDRPCHLGMLRRDNGYGCQPQHGRRVNRLLPAGLSVPGGSRRPDRSRAPCSDRGTLSLTDFRRVPRYAPAHGGPGHGPFWRGSVWHLVRSRFLTFAAPLGRARRAEGLARSGP